MNNLTYTRMLSIEDTDIPQIASIYLAPEVSQYLSIADNYFRYVTSADNVFFYKVFLDNKLIGTVHMEKLKKQLYLSILVFPEFQRMGFGATIIKDIQNDVFMLNFEKIEVSIDENNVASLELFKNAGFTFTEQDGKLMSFIYQKQNSQ